MAGFQVIMYGRFWVITEGRGFGDDGDAVNGMRWSRITWLQAGLPVPALLASGEAHRRKACSLSQCKQSVSLGILSLAPFVIRS